MCLIALAVDAPGPWLLVMAANRDEFHDRPAVPAAWWDGTTQGILAGRDLQAGGTWLGLRHAAGATSLRIAALTNLRPGLMPPTSAPAAAHGQPTPSRGGLVAGFLSAPAHPAAFLDDMTPLAGAYAGFNLLAIGSADPGTVDAWYLNNLPGSRPRRLDAGLHVLSNAVLGVEWPKTRLLADAMTRVLEGHSGEDRGSTMGEDAGVQLGEDLLEALADRTTAPDADLPDTGLERSRERLLSAPFIVDDHYGTRCSTVLVVSRTGHVYFAERSFGASGRRAGTVVESFRR